MVLLTIYNGFQGFFDTYGDERTKGWFLMSSPLPTALVCLTYVFIVKKLGPQLMANRKPYTLRTTLIVYNLFQVIFSTWLFYECMMAGWWNEYSLKCQPVDYSDSPSAKRLGMSGWFTNYSLKCEPCSNKSDPQTMRMVNICWWYYFSKFTEFFDTFFFVLRKKYRHVSTLHVIHHGVMPLSVWFGVRFYPGGHSTFFGLLNTFVHIIMYAYYLLAALGPEVQKYLWWKKYLTSLQMVQFVAITVHAFQLLFIDCDYPRAFVWWIGMHAVMFFFLFKQFYHEQYSKPSPKAKVEDRNGSTNGAKVINKPSDYYVNGEAITKSAGVTHRPSASTSSN